MLAGVRGSLTRLNVQFNKRDLEGVSSRGEPFRLPFGNGPMDAAARLRRDGHSVKEFSIGQGSV